MMLTKIFTLLSTVVFSLVLTENFVHGDDAEVLRTANPLLEPWRITQFPELEGRGLRCIAEDLAGNIWFGLRDGVVRYDGYEWQDFGKDDGLPGTDVFSIVRRSSGQLVAATEVGLFEQQGTRWHRLFPSDDRAMLETSYVIEAHDAAIWACTPWGLLRLNDTVATLFTSGNLRTIAVGTGLYDQVIAVSVNSLPRARNYLGSDIRLLGQTVVSIGAESPARAVGMQEGDRVLSVNGQTHGMIDALNVRSGEQLELLLERRESGRRETVTFMGASSRGGYRDPAMNSVMQDSHGALWAGLVGGGLIMSPDGGESWRTQTKTEGFTIGAHAFPLETSDGSIWAFSAGRQDNANRYDGEDWTTGDLLMLGGHRFISAAAQTVDGTIWVGGLSKMHVHRYGKWTTHDTRDVQLPSDSLRLMVASDQAIWIGGYDQTAVRIAIAEEEFLSLESSEHLCTEPSGTQWFVHGKRLVRKDGAQTVSYGVDVGTIDDASGMVAVPDGVVVFGSHNQIAAVSTFRNGIWNRKLFPKVARAFNKMGFTSTRAGTVWIGTKGRRDSDQAGGVVHGVGDDWQHFAPPDVPPYCTSALEFPDGRMWFGGAFGVVQYDGESWTQVNDPLLEDTDCPRGTIDSSGRVFMATRTKGILKYEDGRWTNLTTKHGLTSSDVSTVHADSLDRLWATTSSGISRLKGNRFSHVDLPAKMGRGSIRSTPDGYVWIDGVIRLGHDTTPARIHVDRNALTVASDGEAIVTWRGVDRWNRTASNNLRWSWRMDNGPWSEFTTDHQIALRDLEPGDHVFEVVNRDGDSNTSASAEAVEISVLAPYWQQRWFILTCISVAVILLWQTFRLLRRGAALRATNQQLTVARKQLAEDFAEKSAQFRAICDCSPVGIFVTNAVGETTYFNKYLGRLSDVASDKPDEATWLSTLHDNDRDGLADAWHKAQVEKTAFRYSARIQARDGSIRWFDVLADRVDEDGTFRGYVGAVEDITERHVAGEEIKEANFLLRSALDQLQMAQEQAVKRERLNALGQMAAGVAHDINNTLTPLLSFAELLQQEPGLSTEGRERAELLRLGVSDTAETVRRLNHFYRPSHNRDFAETVDMADIVRQTVELTKPKWFDESQARGKRTDVSVEITAEPLVLGESSQLRAVLTNLIFNSVDAISAIGKITIRVEQHAEVAVIEVCDSGQGMDAERLNRCTDPFYTSKSQGGGLGLSECYGIVRQHGGELAINSVVHQGTNVRFELPCSVDQQVKDILYDDVQSVPQPLAIGKHVREPTRVLYIDDNEFVRRSTCVLLSTLDVQVDTANDGPEGLEKLEHGSYRFVLLDQGLPGMDGLTVLGKIKERWPDLPVAMVSGWTLPELEAGCGPDDFLEKPFSIAELTRLVKKYLSPETSSR